jgi:hypothetical protein
MHEAASTVPLRPSNPGDDPDRASSTSQQTWVTLVIVEACTCDTGFDIAPLAASTTNDGPSEMYSDVAAPI